MKAQDSTDDRIQIREHVTIAALGGALLLNSVAIAEPPLAMLMKASKTKFIHDSDF
jgi:hypothetical protein